MQSDSSKIQDLLLSLGLTETEASIYRYGLEHDSVTAQDIGTATKIKRPTIYHALQTLTDKGLVIEQGSSGKTRFTMKGPAHIQGWIQKQKEALEQKEDLVQTLVSQFSSHTSPGIQIVEYTNAKDIQSLFDLAFFARSRKCIIVASNEALKDVDGARSKDAEARGVSVTKISRPNLESSLLLFDDTVAIIHEKRATVIRSEPFCIILSAALDK